MPWGRLDDNFHDHPKVLAVLDAGHPLGPIGLWTLARSWCLKQLTDGRITLRQVQRIGGTEEEVAALVQCGLWQKVGTGYRYKDWSDYNPTRRDVEEKRKADRERQRRIRGGVASDTRASLRVVGDPRPGPTQPIPEDGVPWIQVFRLWGEITGRELQAEPIRHKPECESILRAAGDDLAVVERVLREWVARDDGWLAEHGWPLKHLA